MNSSIELAHNDVKRVVLADKMHTGATPAGDSERMNQYRNDLTHDFQDEV